MKPYDVTPLNCDTAQTGRPKSWRAPMRGWAGALALLAAIAGAAQAQSADPLCDTQLGGQGAGPYDYRTSTRAALHAVEQRHFTFRVETLLSGESTRTPGPDINYTLSKFPNHHRALLALVRLGARLKTARVPDMPYTVACYFERALTFRSDDTVTRVMYAGYLGSIQQTEAATAHLERAAVSAQDNPLTHYNIGMTYLELKNFDRAMSHAKTAYELGASLPELRDRLRAAGRWIDAEPPAASASAPAQ